MLGPCHSRRRCGLVPLEGWPPAAKFPSSDLGRWESNPPGWIDPPPGDLDAGLASHRVPLEDLRTPLGAQVSIVKERLCSAGESFPLSRVPAQSVTVALGASPARTALRHSVWGMRAQDAIGHMAQSGGAVRGPVGRSGGGAATSSIMVPRRAPRTGRLGAGGSTPRLGVRRWSCCNKQPHRWRELPVLVHAATST